MSLSQPILSSRLRGFVCKSCLSKLQKPQRPLQPLWSTRSVRTLSGPRKGLKGSKVASQSKQRQEPEPVIKHFEQGPDGERVEMPEGDSGDPEFREMMSTVIKDLDKDIDEASDGLGMEREEYMEKMGITQKQLEKKFGISSDDNPWEKQDGPDEEEIEEFPLPEFTEEDYKEEIAAREREENDEEELENPNPPEEIWNEHEMTDDDFVARMSEDERRHRSGQDKLVRRMQEQMNRFSDLDNISEAERLELRRMLEEDLEEARKGESLEDIREYPDDDVIQYVDEEGDSKEEEVDPQKEPKIKDAPPIESNIPAKLAEGVMPSLKQILEQGLELDPDQQRNDQATLLPEPHKLAPNQQALVIPEATTFSIRPEKFGVVHQKSIKALNNCLTRAYRLLKQDVIGDNIQRDTWRYYMLCRKAMLENSEQVPYGVWWLVWQIFERPGKTNVGRMDHILRLGNDMKAAGLHIQPQEMPLFIESMFISGERTAALQEWKLAERTLGENELTFRRFWVVGIRMYSLDGQAEKALQAMSKFLSRSDSPADYRLLLPILRAFLLPRTDDEVEKAWAIYELFKYHVGDLMRMKDYDFAAMSFLEADQPDLALRVFVDMMHRAKATRDAQNRPTEYGVLDLAEIASLKISVMHSQTLVNLPAEFNNKFFFGSWIKKLIGEGDLSGAQRVFHHMKKRGIRADPKHMNGLIGAWYRSGSGKNQAMADETAWQMIAARIEFVKQRDAVAQESTFQLEQRDNVVKMIASKGKDDQRILLPKVEKPDLFMPQATIETFSILMEQYRRRHRQDLIKELFEALSVAKVRPNTSFMNEMISAHMKTNKTSTAWQEYTQLTKEHRVQPDFDTFTLLWHIEKKATDPVTRSGHKDFISCQDLFREMVNHSDILTRKETMQRNLYDSIILAFGLADDQAGAAVAMRALQQRFNMYPNEQTARSIILQVSRAGLRNSIGFRPRRLNLNPETKERISEVSKVLAAFKQQRVDTLAEQGIEFEQLAEDDKVEEALMLMTNLLRFVLASRLQGEAGDSSYQVAAEKSKLTAEKMGVPDCDPWAV